LAVEEYWPYDTLMAKNREMKEPVVRRPKLVEAVPYVAEDWIEAGRQPAAGAAAVHCRPERVAHSLASTEAAVAVVAAVVAVVAVAVDPAHFAAQMSVSCVAS